MASGRLPSRDGAVDGDGGSKVLLGLLMSPSPTRVRSVLVSSSTVRSVVRASQGREMGDKWVPKVGWRGGGNKHRRVPVCPLALELREESRLSERRLEVRVPRTETPFSRVCLRDSGVEQARPGGVRRRNSGSTRSSLFKSPRWSLARALCARLSSSKNSAKRNTPESDSLRRLAPESEGLVGLNMQRGSLTPDKTTSPGDNSYSRGKAELRSSPTQQEKRGRGGLPSASSILIFFCFLFSPSSAESGPLALTEKSFGVDLSSPCRCNNENALC